MADEMKKESKNILRTMTKVIVGTALIILGVVAIIVWRWSILELIKGCVGPLLILVGIIFLAIAKE